MSRTLFNLELVLLVLVLAGCSLQEGGIIFDNPTEPGDIRIVAANRAPDPPAGQRLPLPDMSHVVREVHERNSQLIRESCQHHGGNWRFLDAVVDRLRQFDTRWGYNWKRGVVGDPSLDIVDYHFSAGPDEGSTDVYIVDVIAGHCGGNPQPSWIDVTDITVHSGTIGRWTGRGRF